MKYAKTWFTVTALRLTASIILALAVALILFVLLGVFIPIFLLDAIFGAVQESPGHGGAIILATVPIAGAASIVAFIFLLSAFRKRMAKPK